MKKAVLFTLMLSLTLTGLVVLWGCSSDDTPTGLSGNGSISVFPLPSSAASFPWSMTGPGGYSHDGAGPATLTDLEPGDYTVTWLTLAGWITPTPLTVTKTLGGGATINFQASYRSTGGVAAEGQVIVDPRPDDVGVDFPWSLAGPGGFSESGVGYTQFDDSEVGTYTLTWGAVPGWVSPDPLEQSLLLSEGDGITFTGTFVEQGGSALEFLPVEAGTFLMGSPRGEAGAGDYEWPQHQVTLTRPFEIARTEITWDQWTQVMGSNPSYYYGVCPGCDGSLPVENVAWIDAVQFCNTLSTNEGLTPAYTIVGSSVSWDRNADGYRLPTEAEWEYACRAGTSTSLPNGNLNYVAASCYSDANLEAIAWYCNNADRHPHEAAGLAANPWGIHDMNGNVWEWVWDWSDNYDSITMVMNQFEFVDGTIETLGTGSIIQAIEEFGSGLLLRLDEVSASFSIQSLGLVTDSVRFEYADFGGEVNLQVNGSTLYKGVLADMPSAVAPGVTLSVTSSPVSDGIFGDGVAGTVVLSGNVTTLLIGGSELMVDDVDVIDSDVSSYGLDRLADFNLKTLGLTFRPNPGGAPQVTLLSCAVTDPIGPSAGGTRMLRGGSYFNNPSDCRSANRSLPDRGIYSGFRVVRYTD
jgi:formylglycine-generating enzyme required for sulfatase activity